MRIAATDGSFLDIRFSGRTWPQATDFWDGNWLNATARGSSCGLQGSVDLRLRVDELHSLSAKLADLPRSHTGQLAFWPMEPNLKLTFQIGPPEALNVFVELQPDLAGPAHMTFELRLDQSSIPSIISQLAADLAPFPQVGQP